MGAYVSKSTCASHYNVTVNCNVTYTDSTNATLHSIGNITKGEFEGDGDIAGVGIFSSFLAVTSFALLLSIIDLAIRAVKWHMDGPGHNHMEKLRKRRKGIEPTTSDILEALVVSCSDTQVITGAAYAITLRYFKGCVITAYHYDIVANMMLLTCATHLLSLAIVRDYWKYPGLALLRVGCITGVFVFTGILLSNQDADADIKFPTKVPARDETNSLLLMSAACFQTNSSSLQGSLKQTFKGEEEFKKAIFESVLGNHIEGWNCFLVILLWYSAALLNEFANIFRRESHRGGRRERFCQSVRNVLFSIINRVFPCCVVRRGGAKRAVQREHNTPMLQSSSPTPANGTSSANRAREEDAELGEVHIRGERHIRRVGHWLLRLYAVIGIGICSWTVVMSAVYIRGMRKWVQRSGWLARDKYGNDTENDATTFGQLVPMCTSGIVLFTLLELVSKRFTNKRDAKNAQYEATSPEANSSHLPSDSPSFGDAPAKMAYSHTTTSVLETPHTEISSPQTTQLGTPMSSPTPKIQVHDASYFPQVGLSPVQNTTVSPTEETTGEGQILPLGIHNNEERDQKRGPSRSGGMTQ